MLISTIHWMQNFLTNHMKSQTGCHHSTLISSSPIILHLGYSIVVLRNDQPKALFFQSMYSTTIQTN